ncbi:MAG: ATP-binding cassette domain-containing protein [Tannerella sp.]|jgi:ABC-2 type transport system ATP-binding protein|nr:ATP-binding cassette domain-containing protein [Tannerella sp.]
MPNLHLNIEQQQYGDKVVLQNIFQDYETGYIHGFLGENGAGKTTLFHCMANLIPYKGVRMLSDHVRFGYLPTELFMYPKITGREFLEFFVTAKGQAFDRNELQKLNELFDLPLKEYADTYSTGMLKKLYLLGLLLQRNEILLLDEPFNGLDFKSSAFFTALIRKYKEGGSTVFISSHDMEHLFSYADTLSVLTESGMSFYPEKGGFYAVKRSIEAEAEKKVKCVSLWD